MEWRCYLWIAPSRIRKNTTIPIFFLKESKYKLLAYPQDVREHGFAYSLPLSSYFQMVFYALQAPCLCSTLVGAHLSSLFTNVPIMPKVIEYSLPVVLTDTVLAPHSALFTIPSFIVFLRICLFFLFT